MSDEERLEFFKVIDKCLRGAGTVQSRMIDLAIKVDSTDFKEYNTVYTHLYNYYSRTIRELLEKLISEGIVVTHFLGSDWLYKYV